MVTATINNPNFCHPFCPFFKIYSTYFQKDFLKKATAPSKYRPLAKELIKHAFLSDCETSKEVSFISVYTF